jgi:arylformamidase
MRILDVTIPISESLAVYPGDPSVSILRHSNVENGDAFTLTSFSMSAHAGTHVDAPLHLFPGAAGVDSMPLSAMIGTAHVIDATGVESVDVDTLKRSFPPHATRVLLKTRRASSDGASWLTVEAARWLVSRGVRLIGIDQMSVDSLDAATLETHRLLLSVGVVVLEGLVLTGVNPGEYEIMCLPLKIEGGDGAPARVVLVEGQPEASDVSSSPSDAVRESIPWTEQARRLAAYHGEAREFVARAAEGGLPASLQDVSAVCRLWLEAELLDNAICSRLDRLNADLLSGTAEMDVTRGASIRISLSGERYLVYECSWALEWDERGITVTLSLDLSTGAHGMHARCAGNEEPLDLDYPPAAQSLENALIEAYFAEATRHDTPGSSHIQGEI